MLNFSRARTQPRSTRAMSLGGIDYVDPKKKSNFVGKILLAAALTFSHHEIGVTHVLVTGGAGYIGSHATLRLLKDSYRVTIVDNLSRGNLGAVKVLQELFPEPGRLQFIYADLGDAKVVNKIFSENAFDAVMHFAAVAYFPINPYGKAKKMAEDIILDFHKNSDMAIMILRYFNVIGSDPEGRLGSSQTELRVHGPDIRCLL
ncbi:UDP-arabinose 4-epimerase 1 [Camellia lanceoleosa]|nr:UDP-arabinose 4-epimerase 1 [Camellia lanceoleosa]